MAKKNCNLNNNSGDKEENKNIIDKNNQAAEPQEATPTTVQQRYHKELIKYREQIQKRKESCRDGQAA